MSLGNGVSLLNEWQGTIPDVSVVFRWRQSLRIDQSEREESCGPVQLVFELEHPLLGHSGSRRTLERLRHPLLRSTSCIQISQSLRRPRTYRRI